MPDDQLYLQIDPGPFYYIYKYSKFYISYANGIFTSREDDNILEAFAGWFEALKDNKPIGDVRLVYSSLPKIKE